MNGVGIDMKILIIKKAQNPIPRQCLTHVFRVHRGGSWINSWIYCQKSIRSWLKPEFSISYIGFRIVRNAEE